MRFYEIESLPYIRSYIKNGFKIYVLIWFGQSKCVLNCEDFSYNTGKDISY
jgi:hypothetical protein